MIFKYLEWHFFDVPRAIFSAWRNFLVFNLQFFSVGPLLKTLFSPWHRYKSSYGKGFDIKKYLEAFVFNVITRIIGAVIRSVLIISGIAVEVFILLVGIIILISWLILPALLIVGLCLSLILI